MFLIIFFIHVRLSIVTQEAFYEQLEKHGGTVPLGIAERLTGDLISRYMPSTRHDAIRFAFVFITLGFLMPKKCNC